MDISPENIGVFDYVLFLGVLYHLRHPLLALEKVSSVTRDQFVLETHVELIGGKRPVMAFYPGDEVNNDPTNWWGPNPSAIKSMLQDVGFSKIKCIYKTPLPARIEVRYSKSWTSSDPSVEQNQTSKNGISCLEINILSKFLCSGWQFLES